MTIDASQGQRCPGELHGFEVNQGTSSSLPFDGLLVHWALGGRAVEDGHRLQGQAMNNVDAAIVKSQSQAWGEKTTQAEQAVPPGTAQTSPPLKAHVATTQRPEGCGLAGTFGASSHISVSQRYASSHRNEAAWQEDTMSLKVFLSTFPMVCSEFLLQKVKEVKFQAKATYLGERQQKLLTQSREEFGVIRHLQISIGQGDWQLWQSHS